MNPRHALAAAFGLVALVLLRIGHTAGEVRPIVATAIRDAAAIAHDEDLATARGIYEAREQVNSAD
jgi:hypothetical protein